jgi:hypothetical protein
VSGLGSESSLRNSMMRVSPEPGCDADFPQGSSRVPQPDAEGRRIAGPGPPSRNGLFGPIALGKGLRSCVAVPRQWSLSAGRAMQKRRPSQCYLRAALTANRGKRLRSCAADCDRPKWVKVQIAVLASVQCRAPRYARRLAASSAKKSSHASCVAPVIANLSTQLCLPRIYISIGRAPAKCGKGGSSDVLVHSTWAGGGMAVFT